MEQYIPKSALVAEIERMDELNIFLPISPKVSEDYKCGYEHALEELLSFINTLEVKEVDLEKEIKEVQRKYKTIEENEGYPCTMYAGGIEWIARHFFELGMAVNNPIAASDRGMAEEIIVNLKRVENDYHIDLTKQMEWLRNIVKKGEEV